MKVEIDLKQWDQPFIKAEPSGFNHIELTVEETGACILLRVTISLKEAEALEKRLGVLRELFAPRAEGGKQGVVPTKVQL